MTEIATYAGQLDGYQAGVIMTPEAAKALDEQVRRCTQAVLREGTDYGIIPGTSGEKTLWRPGAQKLLQWFGLGYACDRIEVEHDDDGRKHGITYKCTVAKRLPDGSLDVKATCEGTADYDESKFHQTAEEVQRKAEHNERKWAKKDGRVADPTKWKTRGEYRADWNALMKRAQKRAIVGAVVDATAAGGIFTDREEDDSPEPQHDDGPTWYEQALEAAVDFTDIDAGRQLYLDATEAHKRGLINRRQQDWIQNRITQRVRLLKTAPPVDAEDLGRQASAQHEAASGPAPSGQPAGNEPAAGPEAEPDPTSRQAASSPTPADSRNAQPVTPTSTAPEDEPGSASADQLQALHIILGALGFTSSDRDAKLKIAETITGRAPLTGPVRGRSSKNLSFTEARKLTDTLDGFGGDREKLIEYMAGREQAGDGDD